MELVISPHGQVRCLYSETIELPALGALTIHRAVMSSLTLTVTGSPIFPPATVHSWDRLSVVPTRSKPRPCGSRLIA